ncbi:MAG: isopentenyl transferase family protein, partial [Patescibacteria group bacterium]
MKQKIIAIVGPTASGKSDYAVTVALRLAQGKPNKIRGGEIISADSRQVYRGMDIGTGKIIIQEMQGITHHLLDIASPKRQFTVVQYQKLANQAIEKILKEGKIPILCGGTGLYIDA